MESGDGLLLRVRPPLGRLSAAGARAVAAAASTHGNGTIELTGRGGLQLRGLAPQGVAAVAAAMVAAGLALADPAAERVRSVVCSPLAGVDPAMAPGTLAVAGALEAALAGTPALHRLPSKALLAVDGGGVLPLGDVGADIAVRLDGGMAEVSAAGGTLRCPEAAVVATVLALAAAWVALGGAPPPRLRALPAAAVFARAGLVAAPAAPAGSAATPSPLGPVPCGTGVAVGLGLPFGQADAATMLAMAALAERYGDGMLRLSPWRAVLLLLPSAASLPAVLAAGSVAGLLVSAADPRRGFAACPGAEGCRSGQVPARRDAAALARALGQASAGLVHVSGCAKGCAHPGPAPHTLVGRDGHYDLVRNGRAGDSPVATGLGLAELLPLLRCP